MAIDKVPASIWKNPIHFLAFGLGSGAAPFAPGTFGTVMAIPFYLVMQFLPFGAYFLLVAVLAAVGIWLCDVTSRDLGVHDHSGIVWDEMVGYWITMLAAPSGWMWMVVGFVLFRLFDIWKPWPISWLDAKVKGGLGIMLDDIIAGGFACIVLQVLVVVWIDFLS